MKRKLKYGLILAIISGFLPLSALLAGQCPHVVLQHLETTLVFPEFRAGDFDHEEWISLKTRSGRIKEAMKFLFY